MFVTSTPGRHCSNGPEAGLPAAPQLRREAEAKRKSKVEVQHGGICVKQARICVKQRINCANQKIICVKQAIIYVKQGIICVKQGIICVKQGIICVKQRIIFLKGCPGQAGKQTRDLLISFIFSFHHFTAEAQRLPPKPGKNLSQTGMPAYRSSLAPACSIN
jgi:hypothetical protein